MLLKAIGKFYKSEDPLKTIGHIDSIVAISYATLPDRLTAGTRECLKAALDFQWVFPKVPIVFSNPAHSGFEGCADREYDLKKEILGSVLYRRAGDCVNSVTEAEAIRDAFTNQPERILIICCEVHSRSIRYIWERVFPKATILIRCVPYENEYGSDYPFKVERNGWIWLCASIARQILLMTLGLKRVSKMYHRAD